MTRLDELCLAFEKSGYPKNMLLNISAKVLNMRRQIETTTTKFQANPGCFGLWNRR